MERKFLLLFISLVVLASLAFFLSRPREELIISPGAEGKFISLINSANDSIYIENYYFTDMNIALALLSAKNRGVRVHVLIENNEGAKEMYDFLKENGIEAKIDKRDITVHAKFIVIDKKIIVIGSHNLTKSAMERNREISILVENGELARKLIDIFESDYAQNL
jgi:cardiolipin synthase